MAPTPPTEFANMITALTILAVLTVAAAALIVVANPAKPWATL